MTRMDETVCDLTKPRNLKLAQERAAVTCTMPHKNSWKRFQNSVFLVQLGACPRERSAI